MKRFSRLGSLVAASCLSFAAAAFAADGGIRLVNAADDSPLLLMHSSQGYLGVDIRDVDNDRAAQLKLKDARGAEIVTVDHDAPAGKAGLRAHDVIQQMNGQPVEGVEQLRRMLRETPAGRTVAFVVMRDGQPVELKVQLGDREKVARGSWPPAESTPLLDQDLPRVETWVLPSGQGAGNGFLGATRLNPLYVGATLDPVGTQLGEYFGVKDGIGLLVKTVDDNSPAAAAGLKAGDVVTKVNGDPMASSSDWQRAIRKNQGKPVQVTVLRAHKEQTLTMNAGAPRKQGELQAPVVLDAQDAPALVSELGEGLAGVDLRAFAQQGPNSIAAFKIDADALRTQLEAAQAAMADSQKLIGSNVEVLDLDDDPQWFTLHGRD